MQAMLKIEPILDHPTFFQIDLPKIQLILFLSILRFTASYGAVVQYSQKDGAIFSK